MSNAEEPKAGQWWLSDEGKPVLIAFDERTIGSESWSPIIAYRKPNCGEWYAVKRFVRRLPDDAGFDWKPEPEIVFPQYCIPGEGGIKTCHNKQVAFWKFDDNENGRTFHTDGTWFPFGSGNFKDDKKRAVTQEEALARITSIDVFSLMFDPKTFTSDWGPFEKSAEPDPEELVTQDRVPARIGIDKGWWSTLNKAAPAPDSSWFNVNRNHTGMMHRHKCDDDTVLNLCCRRADLPPLPESKPNRIPVRLYWYDGNVVARYGHTPPTDPSFVEIKLDPQRHISDSGFYVEGTGT